VPGEDVKGELTSPKRKPVFTVFVKRKKDAGERVDQSQGWESVPKTEAKGKRTRPKKRLWVHVKRRNNNNGG